MQTPNYLDTSESNWQFLLSVFPKDWEQIALETGALKGLRKNKDPENLLRTLLMHIGNGYSLRETVARARIAGLADLSDVGLLKRLRKCSLWLQTMAQRMLFENQCDSIPDSKNKRIRVFDASIIHEPGQSGSQWRLHFSLGLPSMECDYFEVTSASGVDTGETFARFPIDKNDYIIADRGYCSNRGIFYVVKECKAHVLVRNISSKTYLNPDGEKFDLTANLETLKKAGSVSSWPVSLKNESGDIVYGRICALRKNKDAIQQAQKKIKRIAARKQKKTKPETLEHAKYVVVFTSFPEEEFSDREILDWYRIRWQVELVFKRFKSIAELGHLPKYDPRSSKAWLYGKLLLALVAERVMHLASEFSPSRSKSKE